MEKSPLVSIILPVYNGEKYLEKSINSCLKQTYKNIELIIVNDCSTDNTLSICDFFVKNDTRVKLINNLINKKLPASLNIGHKKAKGNYLTWTSDDNLFKPNAIEKLVNRLISNTTIDYVYSNYELINDLGVVYKSVTLPSIENAIWSNVFGPSFMYKKEVFEHVKGYNEDLFLVEDYDFWLNVIISFKALKIDESLYYYRYHDDNLTFSIFSNNTYNTTFQSNYRIMLKSFLSNNDLCDSSKAIQILDPFHESKFEDYIGGLNEMKRSFRLLSKNDNFYFDNFINIYFGKIFDTYMKSKSTNIYHIFQIIYFFKEKISFDIFYKLLRRFLINNYRLIYIKK